jgi:small subunit ribosomal protein S24e
MKILQETKNPLLKRKEIKAEISYEGATPNRAEVKNQLGQKGHLIIRRIKPVYGEGTAVVEAVVYDNKEIADKIEAEHLKKKNHKEEPKKEESEENSAETAPEKTASE